jgi:hypothetical protein
LQILSAGMQEQMYVGVDQPRQQRPVAEIDDFGALRMRDHRTGFGDSAAPHEHFARRHYASVPDVEQARRMKHDSGWRSRLGLPGSRQEQA